MDERLDRWALAHSAQYLKTVRRIFAIFGIGLMSIAVIAWFVLVGILTSGTQVTWNWFVCWQVIPAFLAYPCCWWGWYSADLALVRNYFGQ